MSILILRRKRGNVKKKKKQRRETRLSKTEEGQKRLYTDKTDEKRTGGPLIPTSRAGALA